MPDVSEPVSEPISDSDSDPPPRNWGFLHHEEAPTKAVADVTEPGFCSKVVSM